MNPVNPEIEHYDHTPAQFDAATRPKSRKESDQITWADHLWEKHDPEWVLKPIAAYPGANPCSKTHFRLPERLVLRSVTKWWGNQFQRGSKRGLWDTLTVSIPDCGLLFVEWDGGPDFGTGQLLMEQLVNVAGLECE